jgi:peroxiredoxin
MTRAFALVGLGLLAMAADARGLEIGSAVPDFMVKPLESPAFAFAEATRTHTAVVVLFLSAVCPYSKYYADHLQELEAPFERKGVLFIGVNSNRTETTEEVVAYARRRGHAFPMVKDAGSAIADVFGARVTPEAFLVDAEGHLRYKGRIRSKIGSTDLKDAMEALLEGRPIRTPMAKAFGCAIQRE